MSDVMRQALAAALLQPENGHSTPLLNRFLSKALDLAPGAEIEGSTPPASFPITFGATPRPHTQ